MITVTLILAALVAFVSVDASELPADGFETRPAGQSPTHRHPPRKLITAISPAAMPVRGPADAPAQRVAA